MVSGRPPWSPFPLSDVSNGEWCPRPPSARQRLAATLLAEQAGRRARRHGLSRRDFLRTAAGTATAFMVLNTVHGLDQWGDAAVLPVKAEHCDDLAGEHERLRARYFVMDVQTHHVDLTLPYIRPDRILGQVACGLRFFARDVPCSLEKLELLGQMNYVKEVFVDSETAVGVISGVPLGTILPVETMARTRDLVNQLAGSERALSQAMIDPTAPPGTQTATDSLEHQKSLGARAIKCYTGTPAGGWWLDSDVGHGMIEQARAAGFRLINVHKGFPLGFGPMVDEYVHTRDLPAAAAQWPDLDFCAYHSGYFPGQGIGEFLADVAPIGKRGNVYAEIGSAFATAFLESPEQAAHLIGSLLKTLGPKRILWGTDSIWWGSPRWQIDAFKTLVISPRMQDEFGYPPLTRKTKARILGLNAARLYGVKPRRERCTVPDALDRAREEQGGVRAQATLEAYGPRTRREFLAFLRHQARSG
ncbi:MAG TPA: amidohydrolase family protein [Candidatus Binatia bacterium]|nr:amidohydrolase family protein [Candidatus Binatia bacterium]